MVVLCEEGKVPAERHALVEALEPARIGQRFSYRTSILISPDRRESASLWCLPAEFTAGRSAAIKADGLKILLSVNPTLFAVNADLDPDIRTNAQIDSAF